METNIRYANGAYKPVAGELSAETREFAEAMFKKYGGQLHADDITTVVLHEFVVSGVFETALKALDAAETKGEQPDEL